jgi:hypothetical protein
MTRTAYFSLICFCVVSLLLISNCRKKETNRQNANSTDKSVEENYTQQTKGTVESGTPVESDSEKTAGDPTVAAQNANDQAGAYDKVLELWKQGNTDNIAQTFIKIDWENPSVFSETSIVKLMSKDMDKKYASLPEAEKVNFNQKLQEWAKTQGTLTRHIIEMARVSITAKKYNVAEQQLNALLRCGEALSQANSTLSIELSGYGTQLRAAEELIRLYTETGEQEKLTAAQKKASEVNSSRSKLLGR